MPLLITPGQLTSRSELFYQLAQVTASGLGLVAALEILHRSPPRASLREPIARLLSQLREGTTFGGALDRTGTWLPTFDVTLLQAGEASGRLPECFRLLADYYAQRAQLARQVLGFVAYPLIVLHLAILIFPIDRFTGLILKGQVLPFALQKLWVLGPLYAGALVLTQALQGTRGPRWRAATERLLNKVPVLGSARRSLALARLTVALDALLNAGVSIIEAWRIAAAASGSGMFERVVADWSPRLAEGSTPAEMVIGSGEFPAAFVSMYHSGEISGTLDDALRRSHVMFQEDGSRRLKQFAFGLAGAFVGCVMLIVALQIVGFWLGYFQQVNDAVNMNAP
jgi:type IV pilus assembly protein PilC